MWKMDIGIYKERMISTKAFAEKLPDAFGFCPGCGSRNGRSSIRRFASCKKEQDNEDNE